MCKGPMFGSVDRRNRFRPWETISREYSLDFVGSQADMDTFKDFTVLSRQCMNQDFQNKSPICLEATFRKKWNWENTTKIGKKEWDNYVTYWMFMCTTTFQISTIYWKSSSWLLNVMLSAGFSHSFLRDYLSQCSTDYGPYSFSKDGKLS